MSGLGSRSSRASAKMQSPRWRKRCLGVPTIPKASSPSDLPSGHERSQLFEQRNAEFYGAAAWFLAEGLWHLVDCRVRNILRRVPRNARSGELARAGEIAARDPAIR